MSGAELTPSEEFYRSNSSLVPYVLKVPLHQSLKGLAKYSRTRCWCDANNMKLHSQVSSAIEVGRASGRARRQILLATRTQMIPTHPKL